MPDFRQIFLLLTFQPLTEPEQPVKVTGCLAWCPSLATPQHLRLRFAAPSKLSALPPEQHVILVSRVIAQLAVRSTSLTRLESQARHQLDSQRASNSIVAVRCSPCPLLSR